MMIWGLHIIDIIVIIIYFAIVLWIGFYAMKKVHNQVDYFLGGRQFGKFFQTFSQFGQATSTESAVQTVSMVGQNGLAAACYGIARGILFNPFAWLFPKWLRRLRLLSMSQYFEERFQSKSLAALYAIALSGLFILVGGSGLYAMSKTVCAIAQKPIENLNATEREEYNLALRLDSIETMPAELLTTAEKTELENLRKKEPKAVFSYFNQKLLIVCIACFVLLYAAGGGLEAAVYTDAMQSIFILILTVLLIPFAMIKINSIHGTSGILGPFEAIHRVLPEQLFEIFGSPRWVEFKWYNMAVLIIISITGNIAYANNLVVSGAAKTEKVASYGGLMGILIRSVGSLFWVVLAMFIVGIFGENTTDPDLLWGMSARTLLPTGLLGLMVACLLAALMSTADTHMMTVTGLLTINIYKPLYPNRSESHYINVGRLFGLIFIGGAIFVGVGGDNIFRMMKIMGFITAACGPAMLMGFLWRRTNAKAAWASMGVALLFSLFIPLFVAMVPSIKYHESLLLEVQAAPVEKVYTASERDLQQRKESIEKWNLLKAKGLAKNDRPEQLVLGAKFSKEFVPPKRAVFWDDNIKIDKNGDLHGDGYFKVDLYLLHLFGFAFDKYSPSIIEFISLSIRMIFPFIAVFIVSLLTAPHDKKILDRFYAKMRTPVNPDHDQDHIDVEKAQADPASTEDVKIFPGSNWEFQHQSAYDKKGMAFGAFAGLVLTLLLLSIAWLGK